VDCYLKCIECENDEGSHASLYLEAANCIKKVNMSRYLEYSQKAITGFSMSGRISNAASQAKAVAENLEEEHDYEEAIKFFERAAELYQMEE